MLFNFPCQFNVGYADAESNIEQAVIDKTREIIKAGSKEPGISSAH